MKSLKIKLIVTSILFLLVLCIFQLSIYATNENVQIIKKSDVEYLIYIKDNLNTNFEFAFSNDKTVDPETLVYINSANDSIDNPNKIAYVNDINIASFANDTYMWVRMGNEYILKETKINLADSILNSEITSIDKVSQKIKVDLSQNFQTEEVVNDVKISKVTGKVVLVDKGNYEYQIFKSNFSDKYSNFMKLADKLAKLNNQNSFYTKLETYHDFSVVYENLLNELENEKWLRVENNEILQPESTADGEEYVLWIKGLDNASQNLVDVQFLSCKKEISQDKIIETITTKLPVTYDNNVLLVILGILVVVTIFVGIRIIILKKLEEK